jgi:hypothetical protein
MDDETKRRIKAMMNKLPLGARGNVVTHLPPQGLDRGTPEGLSATYFYIGMECASDARNLSKASPHFPLVGQCILSCHALEVSLKSFLAREGLSETELRGARFGRGHDLIALYDEAVKRGLDFSQFPEAKAIVNVFNQYHYKLDDQDYASASHFVTTPELRSILRARDCSTSQNISYALSNESGSQTGKPGNQPVATLAMSV